MLNDLQQSREKHSKGVGHVECSGALHRESVAMKSNSNKRKSIKQSNLGSNQIPRKFTRDVLSTKE